MKYAYILFCVIPNSFSTDRTESNSSPKSNLQNVTLAQKTRHTHMKNHIWDKNQIPFSFFGHAQGLFMCKKAYLKVLLQEQK